MTILECTPIYSGALVCERCGDVFHYDYMFSYNMETGGCICPNCIKTTSIRIPRIAIYKIAEEIALQLYEEHGLDYEQTRFIRQWLKKEWVNSARGRLE